MERHLKKENEMYKQQNSEITKEIKQLRKKTKKLETQNILISKQAYKWLKENKHWQCKYEKQKVKNGITKGGKRSKREFT